MQSSPADTNPVNTGHDVTEPLNPEEIRVLARIAPHALRSRRTAIQAAIQLVMLTYRDEDHLERAAITPEGKHTHQRLKQYYRERKAALEAEDAAIRAALKEAQA